MYQLLQLGRHHTDNNISSSIYPPGMALPLESETQELGFSSYELYCVCSLPSKDEGLCNQQRPKSSSLGGNKPS